ncbi:MAG: hypothetical protein HFI38_08335 [Lachnospiraceae bacterium]|jgi:hypothetical protein|nr:hypothetical protein [Lachnospiraceae bacterium]
MSEKDLLYIEDALGHEQILKKQCEEAAKNLSDPDLRSCVEQLSTRHQEIFDQFYQLV